MAAQSFELDALLGFAKILAENPAPRVRVWSEHLGTPAPAGAVGVWVDLYPEEVDSITLADYTVDDGLYETWLGVQVTIKARDLTRVKAITSEVFDLFHMRWGGMLGPIQLVSARRSSGTNTGQDSNGRQVRIENYYIQLHRPTPNRF